MRVLELVMSNRLVVACSRSRSISSEGKTQHMQHRTTGMLTKTSQHLIILHVVGKFVTCSKLLNGTVTAGGSLIQSGILPLKLARFLLFAPTTPSLNSFIVTTHFPHQFGMEIERFSTVSEHHNKKSSRNKPQA